MCSIAIKSLHQSSTYIMSKYCVSNSVTWMDISHDQYLELIILCLPMKLQYVSHEYFLHFMTSSNVWYSLPDCLCVIQLIMGANMK